jgi:hypothetical protein
MNKFAKSLLIAIVLAAPVAISSSAVKAETRTTNSTHYMGTKPTTVKSLKTHTKKHHRHHIQHKTVN